MKLPNEPAGAEGAAEAREAPPSPEDWHKPDCKFRKSPAVFITINTPFVCPECGGKLREINTEGKWKTLQQEKHGIIFSEIYGAAL